MESWKASLSHWAASRDRQGLRPGEAAAASDPSCPDAVLRPIIAPASLVETWSFDFALVELLRGRLEA